MVEGACGLGSGHVIGKEGPSLVSLLKARCPETASFRPAFQFPYISKSITLHNVPSEVLYGVGELCSKDRLSSNRLNVRLRPVVLVETETSKRLSW